MGFTTRDLLNQINKRAPGEADGVEPEFEEHYREEIKCLAQEMY